MRQSISQILNHAGSLETKKEQVEYLQKNYHPGLVNFCRFADPSLKWLVPEGAPPYKVSEYDEPSVLYTEARRLYIFVEGGPKLTSLRREQLFIELLETLDKDDAKLLIDLKDGKLPGTLTYAILKRAFETLP